MRNKKIVAALALGAVAVTGGIAYAFYATSIDSSPTAGSAEIAANEAENIVATLGSAATGLVPGAGPQTLTVTLTNPNAFSVGVVGETLTLDFAGSTTAQDGCTVDKAALSAAPVTGYENVFTASGTADATDSVTFDIEMADLPELDQTDCAGATFVIPVVVSPK